MTETQHPGQSAEFLSRHHDGDLTADERAAFDAHRESCSDCRAAVEEFERTLSLYRAAPTHPPASDLSARILRKIRTQSPARRPFGVSFGIDVRWAGALVAAILVVILGAPLWLRREMPKQVAAPESSIPAHLVESEAAREEAAADTRAIPREKDSSSGRAPAPRREKAEPPRVEASGKLAAEQPAAAPEPQSAAPEAARDNLAAPAPEKKSVAPAFRREATASDRSGGESEAANTTEPAPVRLTVVPVDGLATVPSVAIRPPEDRLTALRGNEFMLLVESGGRVREVTRARSPQRTISKQKTLGSDEEKIADESEILRELRFQPGDRPRRLLVRIE
ncbi:MAG TPA: zf-HC2 domain-containing protein [Thermoanaerobaculia bacterium]